MLLDKLLHHDFKRDFDHLFKARVLLAIICVYFLIVLSVALWLQFSAPVSMTGRTLGLGICLFMLSGYLIAIFIMHRFGWFHRIAHFIVFVSAAGIIGGITISGGPLHAPATPMNIIPIIMAFVLISKRAGMIWTQAILATHILMIAANGYGFDFPQLLQQEMMLIQHLAHWIVTYSAMTGLLFVFVTLNSHLKAERDAERQRFEHLASHDSLTGLANRLQFNRNLTQSMSRSHRHEKMMALFFIDLDDFKPINDNQGHDAGDMVLKEVSQRLKNNVRAMDTVARLGGDEFGVILEDIADEKHLSMLASKLHDLICQPIVQLDNQPQVSASIGIAIYPLHTEEKIDLVKYADTAMYAAKTEKNHWALFHQDMLNGNEE